MVRNFRYEEAHRIALSGVPESVDAVDWLHAQGIRAVVSLHPVADDVVARMGDLGIAWRPCFLEDFSRGVPAGLPATLDFIAHQVKEAPAVLIH
jgi:hypothetical protein